MSGTKRWSVYDSFDRTGPLENSKPIWTPSLLSLFEGLPTPPVHPEVWATLDSVSNNSPYVSDGRAFLPGGSSNLPGMLYAYYGTEWIRRAIEAGLIPGGDEPSEEVLQKLLDYVISTIHRRLKFSSGYASALVTDLEFSGPSNYSLTFTMNGIRSIIIHGNVNVHAPTGNPLEGMTFETDGLFIGGWTHVHGFYTDLPFLPGGSWLNSTLQVYAVYISRSSSPPPSSLSSFFGPIPTSSAGLWMSSFFPGHYFWGSSRMLTYFFDSGNLSEVGWQASNGIVNLKMPWTSGSSLADLGSGDIPYLLPPPLVPGKAIFALQDGGGGFTDVTQNTNTLNWNNFCSQIPSSGAGYYSFDRFMPIFDPGMIVNGGETDPSLRVSISSFKTEVDIPQGGKGGWHVGGITAGAGGSGGMGFAYYPVSILPTVAASVFNTGVLSSLNLYFNSVL